MCDGRLVGPGLVGALRRCDLDLVRSIGLLEVPTEEFWRDIGRSPIGAQWDVRFRLVVADLSPMANMAGRTSSQRCHQWNRHMCCFARQSWGGEWWQRRQLTLVDIRKALLDVGLEDGEVAFINFPGVWCGPAGRVQEAQELAP